MLRYSEPVYRPPSEARSFILQATLGCSYNRCTFCAMYRSKRFRVRPLDELESEIGDVARSLPDTRRVFLADGDAMVLSPSRLTRILDSLSRHFPRLQRVSVYADAKSILSKSPAELAELYAKKLRLVYIGLESGSEAVLSLLRKEASADEMTQAVVRAREAGMKASVIALLGAGGKALSDQHSTETARIISAMSPSYFSALTLTVVPGTPLAAMIDQGEIEPISARDSLRELRTIVAEVDPARPTIFRSNHASNYLPLDGVLPRDRDTILKTIDWALSHDALRPEWMRGL